MSSEPPVLPLYLHSNLQLMAAFQNGSHSLFLLLEQGQVNLGLTDELWLQCFSRYQFIHCQGRLLGIGPAMDNLLYHHKPSEVYTAQQSNCDQNRAL